MMKYWPAFLLVGFTVLLRFLPHPPNFSPVLGLALFSGCTFSNRRVAYFLPLSALLISDFFLGFYDGMILVYLSYALTIGLGALASRRKLAVGAAAGTGVVLSSVVFFMLSNLSVWLYSGMYPKSWAGLVDCYVMGLPFFPNTLISTAICVAVLLGVYAKIAPRVEDRRVLST
ncbi:MAG: hypothetical protein A2Z20_07775 [Bdellovibrionales bacterium RBG_16_40_8]|nr:MAG: hypothetical protein A2Z20_07775 [Bdellovibrionales bacterium RBG_16_40_8]